MAISARAITPAFFVAPQLSPQDVAEAAAQGFKSILNNRPDHEGGAEQPLSSTIEAAAHAAGLAYVHLPVVSGAYTAEQVQAMHKALQELPAPVLAFCRSGMRAGQMFELAQTAR
ncbi:MAG: TIGR01244 family phosphatase [Curvibacter sp.]|jgi:uncharacterized protein (TIGR01244 family)|nr:MAG: TIGR01244 family phosphatase [Curvibacter sp.]